MEHSQLSLDGIQKGSTRSRILDPRGAALPGGRQEAGGRQARYPSCASCELIDLIARRCAIAFRALLATSLRGGRARAVVCEPRTAHRARRSLHKTQGHDRPQALAGGGM